MEPVCHRCGETLVADELYCPHCGAPQLRVEESDAFLSAREGSLQMSLDRVADVMRWRSAITAALLTAIPTALLSVLLSLGALWVFAGGFLAVSFYRRRTRSSTDGRIGWRIGGLMGLLAAIFWLAFEAVSMVIVRYALNRQPAIVGVLKQSLQTSIATVSRQNPEFAHQFPWMSHFWLSPSGIASFFLISNCLMALSMVLFSALGGLLSGSYQRNRPPPGGAI